MHMYILLVTPLVPRAHMPAEGDHLTYGSVEPANVETLFDSLTGFRDCLVGVPGDDNHAVGFVPECGVPARREVTDRESRECARVAEGLRVILLTVREEVVADVIVDFQLSGVRQLQLHCERSNLLTAARPA